MSVLGLNYSDADILQSLYNYNNTWYNVIKNNEDTINNIWQIIYTNHSVVYKKKYGSYKILMSYIYLQAIIECFCSINSGVEESHEYGDYILKVSGWTSNYELVNSGYKLFKKFIVILSLLGMCVDKNVFEKNIFYVVEILCLNKLMSKKIITKNNKSQVFVKINNFDYQHDINFKISLSTSTCFEYENTLYKIEKSIYSVNNVIHSDVPLQEKPILNIGAVLLEDCIEFKINKDYLKITKEVIISRLNKINKTWDSILNKVHLKNTSREIKKLNKQITIIENTTEMDNNTIKTLKHLKQKLREYAVQFSNDLTDFETIALLNHLENNVRDSSIYFMFFLDFRGRMYTISTYGPVSNKIIRNVLVYNNNKYDLNINQIWDSESQTLKIIKDKYYNTLDTIKLKNNSDLFKSSLFWVLISLASHHKSKLLESNKVNINTLLNSGIDMYINKNYSYEGMAIDEEVELKRNLFIIDQLVLGKFDYNTFICKDSTASVFQHLFIYLQPKNKEALEICNIIGSGSWHDPYSTIISRFLTNRVVDDFTLSLFNRKTLKKSIMTHPYSVTYYSSWNYFKIEINKYLIKSNKITLDKLDKEKQDKIKKLFKDFFTFLSKDFEVDVFYKKNSTEIKKKINFICFDDGTKINFNYLRVKNNRKEIKNKKLKIRISYNENYTNNQVDYRQTEIAIRANLIHATDAYFARLVILRFSCLTIHDCFCIKLHDINNCIDFMNNFFRKEIFKNKDNYNNIINTNGLDKLPYSLTIIF